MLPRIVRDAIDEREVTSLVGHPGAGAVLTFAGTVRDEHLGRAVVSIDYHAYEEMAALEIEKIEEEITRRWPDARARIVHRIGHLKPGATSVLIAVAAPHRAEGFEALRFGIDTLKERAPIWKRELYSDGTEAWLEGS